MVLAPQCAGCRAPLDRLFRGPVCEACWAAVRLLTPPLCGVCGTPIPPSRRASIGGHDRCGVCRTTSRPIDRERSAGHYDGALRAIIHAFKYDRRRSLARPLASLMRAHCAGVLQDADACVPVPLHWRRRWQRGFNQAEELAGFLGLPVIPALRRSRQTRAQATLHADQRLANVGGAFVLRRRSWWGVRRPRTVAGLTLVLVDDVTTTGATLEACARVLKDAGAREVRAVTAARVAARSRR